MAPAVSAGGLRHATAKAHRREDLAKQVRQLPPLGVLTAAAHLGRQRFEPGEGLDLELQLGDGAGRGGLVEHFLFGCLDLVLRRLIEVLDVIGVEQGAGDHERRRGDRPALQEFQLAQALLQPLAAPPERLVDRLGPTPYKSRSLLALPEICNQLRN